MGLTRRRPAYRYLLGDAAREAARLRAQARLWDPVSLAMFDRIGVGRGWRVLEIGPGQGSLHMALRQRVKGPVDAVERSPAFAARLATLTARDGFGPGRVWNSNLIDTALPRGQYDLIFARWVFLFLPDPQAHIRHLVRALRPGGLLALQDYHREGFAMIPRPKEWTNFLAADAAFFASQGGDVSVGGRLPAMYRTAGLTLVDTAATVKTGRPGSPVWNWITTYFLSVMHELAKFPPFDAGQAAALGRCWRTAACEKTTLLIAPAVIDVVGRKRARRTTPLVPRR